MQTKNDTRRTTTMNLKNKHFLKLLDYTPEEICYLLELSKDLKDKKKKGIPHKLHEGKSIALIFEKTSTRTRCSFEIGAADLGINTVYLPPTASQIGKKESIPDTARVLGRMFDGIEYRGFGQEVVETLAEYSGVPVWNGLTDEAHPTQILADFLTIQEHLGELKGKKLVFMGDCAFNMSNTLMAGCTKMGMHYVACAPEGYQPQDWIIEECKKIAAETGGSVEVIADPYEAVAGADIIYTDVWVSMGMPDSEWDDRLKALMPYQVNQKLMDAAGEQALFMHCLPAFHDLGTTAGKEVYEKYGYKELEVTDEVFEGPKSIVFDEAENRLHTIKAIMAATL